MEHYVYLMRDKSTGYYKIGLSYDPSVREKTLQSEKPVITLLSEKKLKDRYSASVVEKTLHSIYSEFRVRGEYFDFSVKELEEILAYFISNTPLPQKKKNEMYLLRGENESLKNQLRQQSERVAKTEYLQRKEIAFFKMLESYRSHLLRLSVIFILVSIVFYFSIGLFLPIGVDYSYQYLYKLALSSIFILPWLYFIVLIGTELFKSVKEVLKVFNRTAREVRALAKVEATRKIWA